MIKQEFNQLRSHDKVKFIGDPKEYVYDAWGRPTKNLLIKGKIYTILNNNVATIGGLGSFSLFGLKTTYKHVPNKECDWELIKTRHQEIEVQRKGNLGLKGVPRTLRRLKRNLELNISYLQRTLNNYLGNIPIEKKMLLLSSFKGEERKLLEFLFDYKDFSSFINTWYNGKDDNLK